MGVVILHLYIFSYSAKYIQVVLLVITTTIDALSFRVFLFITSKENALAIVSS